MSETHRARERDCLRIETSDRGDTLVEVLVTVVIVGAAVVALLGALLTTTSASVTHRNLATIDAVLASFAETARSTVEIQAFNGSSSGPAFIACASNYQIAGSPNPKSGPVGSAVDVFGTGFSVIGGSPIGGAKFNGALISATASSSSSSAGAISDFTVPTEPAGSYQVIPFGGTTTAASTFTVTPLVGTMSPTVPGSVGVGTKVNVPVSGFSSGATLTVTVGGTTVLPGNVSGNPIAADGTGTLTFQIPPFTGPSTVTISDGPNTAAPVMLDLGSNTGPANPVPSVSTFGADKFTMTVGYWNPAVGGPWSTDPAHRAAACSDATYNPNIQQLNFTLVDNQPGNGADGGVSIVVANFDPQALASPPVALTTSRGDALVNLSWDAPGYTGESALTGYNIYRSNRAGTQGALIKSVGPAITTYTDTGLINGTTYYYEVTAVNTVGESAVSNQASATPATTPGAPTGLNAAAGNAQVGLSWTAPASTGGSAITGYNIYRSTTLGTQGPLLTSVGPTTTTYTDTGLTNGTTYYYEVTAVNAVGESAVSNQASATPVTVPGAPTGLTAAPGDAQVGLSWTAPASNGGSAITGYNIYRSTTSGTQGALLASVGPTITTYTDTGLTNGTTYYYEVTAVNTVGESTASNQVEVEPGVPGPPTRLTAIRGSGKVSLSWTAPSPNGTSPITGYNVYRSTTSGTQGALVASVGPTTTYIDTGLTGGTKYYYEVTAVNSVGEGPASNQASATPR